MKFLPPSLASRLRDHRARADVLRRLRRFNPLLRAGTWRVWPHLAAGRPEPGETSSPTRDRFVDNQSGTGGFRDVHIDGGERLHADILLPRSYCTLLVPSDGSELVRLYEKPDIPQRLVENARRLATHLPVPRIDPLDPGLAGIHGVREPLFSGRPLGRLDTQSRTRTYRLFLDHCATYAAAAQTPATPRATKPDAAVESGLPADVRDSLTLHWPALQDVLAAAPTLFAHGDCHLNNILLRDDGQIVLIDLERAQWLPFFFDALWPLCNWHEAGQQLRREFLEGHFDREFTAVWQAAGQQFDTGLRRVYLLAMALAHADRVQYRGRADKRSRKLANTVRAVLAE